MQVDQEPMPREEARPDTPARDGIAQNEANLLIEERAQAEREEEHRQHCRAVRSRVHGLITRLTGIDRAGHDEAVLLLEQLHEGLTSWLAVEEEPETEARWRAVRARQVILEERQRLDADRVRGVEESTGTLLEIEARADVLEEAIRQEMQTASEVPKAPEVCAQPVPTVPDDSSRRADQAAPKEDERRRAPRVEVSCQLGFDTDHNFYTGLAENLSVTGIFVATYDLLEIGERVHLTFMLPEGQAIESEAVVRWVRESTASPMEIWPGMGLQFENLEARAAQAIASFVETREPLFFPD